MGRIRSAVERSRGPVVVHLDRAVAIDLLQALTQALEPYANNIADVKQAAFRGKSLVGKSLTAKSIKATDAKGTSANGPSRKAKTSKGKTAKGRQSKRSR